jgi:DNA repair exonuclease SbcCD ATPase subunit
MKQIVLERLVLRNFKGIREFTLDARGANVNVYGDNAAGKTTLFDAWNWLLFDKDSENKSTGNFEIKTLRPDGSPIHNLEHEVEGVLLIEGRRTTLRKVYREVWTKKRGSAKSEFSRHTTDYFVDGVPVKKGEYEAAVASIVDEDIFRLLTDPRYFNEVLKWNDRRKILLEVCGDMTDDEVIASSPALAELPAILGGRTIEQHRKVVLARRKEINDELERIPDRIDEANRAKPDVSGYSEDELRAKIDTLKIRIEEKQDELRRIQNGGEIAEKEKRLRELEGELLAIKNELLAGTMDKLAAKRQELAELRRRAEEADYGIQKSRQYIEKAEREIAALNTEAERLREEWRRVNAEQFDESTCGDANCPTCGQALPEEQVAAARQKAEADFNRKKAERLEQINQRGKAVVAEAERYREAKAEHERTLFELQEVRGTRWEAVEAAEKELAELQAGMTNVSDDPRYIAKHQELETVKADIAALRSSNLGALDAVRLETAKLRNELEMFEQRFARFAIVRQQEARIAELEVQEKALAEEFERLEHELHLLDLFTRAKVDLLENRINSRFLMARFKLFNQLLHGGLEETCEVMVDGVPYGSLNNAARHNVGLDIIATLSEHFGVCAPIFLDNAESVTRPLPTPGQQIRLIVSAGDKTLRVETEQSQIKEVV